MDIEEYTKLCDRAIALIKEANEKLKDRVVFVAYIKFIKQLVAFMDGEQK